MIAANVYIKNYFTLLSGMLIRNHATFNFLKRKLNHIY